MQQFLLISKLVLRQLRLHPGRVLVTLAGIAASACAVVWVVSGYDALVSQFDENAGKYLGRYDLLVVPQGHPDSTSYVAASMVEQLYADVGVLELNPIHQSRVTVNKVQPNNAARDQTALGLLLSGRPPVYGAPPIEPVLVGSAAREPPYTLLAGNWIHGESAVLSSGAAESLHIAVGDEVLITTMANQVKLQVAGIVEQAPDTPLLSSQAGGRGSRGTSGGKSEKPPSANKSQNTAEGRPVRKESSLARATERGTVKSKLGIPKAVVQGVATAAVYVRPEVAERINGFKARPTVLQVALRDTITSEQFIDKWQDPFLTSQPPLKIVDYSMVRDGLTRSRGISAHRAQAYAATGFASLAATFIIFSMLSMGVSERARELALLRAVAFSRAQIAALVAVECLVLALVGWLGGLLAGLLLVLVGGYWMPSMFASGVALGWTSVWLTGATVLSGALCAAVLPAWKATRIRPLDALSSTRFSAPPRPKTTTLLLVGLCLIAAAPLSVFGLPLPDDWRIACYAVVTYPALLVGMALLTPAVVVNTERFLSGVVAKLLGLDVRLLRAQLSNNLWRTVGATLALSLGLGLFVSTQIWGYSMLQPFLPGKWLPDLLVSFQPNGLDPTGVTQVKNIPGIEPSQVMPLAIEQAKLDWGEADPPQAMGYDNTVLFGVDAMQCFSEGTPLLDIEFVDGDSQVAAQALSTGDTCVISLDFSRNSGKRIGDTITLIPPAAEQERVSYQVVGIVDLPGWQWITKFSGVRRHFVRTSSMMLVDRQSVLRKFHLKRPEFCWINLTPHANIQRVEAELQKIAESHALSDTFEADGLGEVASYRPFARVTATDTVTQAIRMHANDTIWGMSQLPVVTLFIMSLAVANTMTTSVRARQWEFGILRAVGTTRLQLVCLVVAETLLIGLSACTLSLAFGWVAGWCGVGMASYGRWGALVGEPAFLIPWQHLAWGFGITLALCVVASAWPALRMGRAEPLGLLSAGRGSR